MRAISAAAQKVADQLIIAARQNGGSIRIESRGFMDLCVEEIQQDVFSFAHYFEQNGDMMRDPDMTFHRLSDGKLYAASFEQSSTGTYRRAIFFNEDGSVKSFYPREQADQSRFAGTWFSNIKAQGFTSAQSISAAMNPSPVATTCVETIGGDPDSALRLSFQIRVF